MKTVYILVLLVAFIGCSGNDDPLCCINIDTSIWITVKSQDSTDLLDPNNPNSYDFQRMRLFYRIGSRKVTAYRSLYPPESVMGSGYYLTMNVPTEVYDSDDPTMYPMYLRWDRYDEDTIKVKGTKNWKRFCKCYQHMV